MGFISFLVFFLGLLHILYLKWVILILILATLVSLRSAYSFVKSNLLLSYDIKFIYSSKLRIFLAILVSLSLLMTLVGAVAPAKGNDALVYHLSDARYFAQNHLVTFIPYTSNSIWPYFMQMLFTLAFLFDNPLRHYMDYLHFLKYNKSLYLYFWVCLMKQTILRPFLKLQEQRL